MFSSLPFSLFAPQIFRSCTRSKSSIDALDLKLAPPLADLSDKQVRLFPRRKMAAPLRLIPIHAILPIPFAPLSGCMTHITRKSAYAHGQVDRPGGGIGLVLQ